jgi:hypothetical protein
VGVAHEERRLHHKKPKYTDQKGKKREYFNLRWSKDGIEFYNEVRKRRRDIALLMTVEYGQTLRELGPSTQRRKFLKTCTVKRIQDMISQAILLTKKKLKRKNYQPTIFCMQDEMNDCHWKENKTGKNDEDGSDYDDECVCVCVSGPRLRMGYCNA